MTSIIHSIIRTLRQTERPKLLMRTASVTASILETSLSQATSDLFNDSDRLLPDYKTAELEITIHKRQNVLTISTSPRCHCFDFWRGKPSAAALYQKPTLLQPASIQLSKSTNPPSFLNLTHTTTKLPKVETPNMDQSNFADPNCHIGRSSTRLSTIPYKHLIVFKFTISLPNKSRFRE